MRSTFLYPYYFWFTIWASQNLQKEEKIMIMKPRNQISIYKPVFKKSEMQTAKPAIDWLLSNAEGNLWVSFIMCDREQNLNYLFCNMASDFNFRQFWKGILRQLQTKFLKALILLIWPVQKKTYPGPDYVFQTDWVKTAQKALVLSHKNWSKICSRRKN